MGDVPLFLGVRCGSRASRGRHVDGPQASRDGYLSLPSDHRHEPSPSSQVPPPPFELRTPRSCAPQPIWAESMSVEPKIGSARCGMGIL
ncbi:unnamed protein product [Sphagnum jensenii]|uniref:Uncharacterized protein n=1 Tax=Sphagnum jensenii TaxID=128206 RepID=A0ABP1AH05_9BRYO